MPNFAIGVDLGGTNLRIAAVDLEGNLLEKVTTDTEVARGRDNVINEMCDAIRALAAKFSRGGKCLGAGIGVPGIIDKRTGMLRESPNLPGWDDYPVRDEIERHLGTPVILENDANSAAYGEAWLGAARGMDDMCMITLGTGVGGLITLQEQCTSFLARGERGSIDVSVEVVVTRFPSGGFDNEHHVVATESERVRDRRTFAQWPRVDGHDVEVNVVVFVVEVQGGRHDVVVYGQQRGDRLDRAGRTEQVSEGRLRRGDDDGVGGRAENLTNRGSFGDVASWR